MAITSLNSHSTKISSGTRYSCISTLLRFVQRTPTNRTRFLRCFDHFGELALGTFDRVDFDSFDFDHV